jgi:hypothetical protein
MTCSQLAGRIESDFLIMMIIMGALFIYGCLMTIRAVKKKPAPKKEEKK